jgi:Holliday junction resolvase
MKAGGSIRKGKQFEREAAKLLTKLTGKEWRRVPSSGAMATAQGIEDSRFKGDLFCEAEEYKDVCVECKITKKPITLVNVEETINRWWKQAYDEANGKMPVLAFTFSGSKWAWLAYDIDASPFHFVRCFAEFYFNQNLKVMILRRKGRETGAT